MLIINRDANADKFAADCTRINLAGVASGSGLGFEVMRGHRVRHCFNVVSYSVRDSGQRYLAVNVRAFGRKVFHREFAVA